jgi:MBOAT, membrane-bound O-acyltransferase family
VHEYLYRHVYFPLSMHFSQFKAYVITLLFSLLFHEYLVYLGTGKIILVIGSLMLFQGPAIFLMMATRVIM